MLAGLAAVALLPLGNIVVEAGYNVLIMAIAVCIVGGLGSWVGAVLAAFVIGFAQILTVVYVESHFQIVVAMLAIIVTLILKPSGLFGPPEGTGGEGLTVAYDSDVRRERLDRGIKVRTSGIYAISGGKEISYLIMPRLVLDRGASAPAAGRHQSLLAAGDLHRRLFTPCWR